MNEQEFREYLEKFFKWVGDNNRDEIQWLSSLEEWTTIQTQRAYIEKFTYGADQVM